MEYLILIYADESRYETMPEGQMAARACGHFSFGEETMEYLILIYADEARYESMKRLWNT